MAAAKKSSKKTETPKEEPKEQLKIDPEAPGEDLYEAWAKLEASGNPILLYRRDADKYIADEYPWLETSQNIPQLLKALVREVVKGRLE